MLIKLVAEIGINHNGDINIVKQLIDVSKLGNAQYVKFQKRDIDLVYTKEELDKPRESPWGTTNRQQKMGLELNYEQYKEIDIYCKEKGIQWYASPWDVNSVDFLMKFDTPFIKIASAMNTNISLLEKIKSTGKDVIVSTGMTSEKEFENIMGIFKDQIKYVLSCTSTYPTKTEDMNMNRIKTLKGNYNYKIGFSNHSAGIIHIIQAAVMRAEMIEYHITLDRSMYGSDQASSIEVPGILKIKQYIESIEKSWGNGRIECLPNEEIIRSKLRK